MKKILKSLVSVGLLVCLVITMAACGKKVGGSSEEKGKLADELNIYICSEYIPDSVIKGFEKQYGIKVNVTFYTSDDEMMAKIMTGGASDFDLLQPSLNSIAALRSEDIIQKLDFDNIPNYKYVDETYKTKYFEKDDAEYCVPYMAGDVAVVYNKNTCPIQITKFDDLLDPALKDQMVCITSSQDIIGMVLSHLGYDPNSTKESEVKEAGKWLMKLKPNIKVFDGDAPRKSLLNGECSVGLMYGGDIALAMQEDPDTFEVCKFAPDDVAYSLGTSQFCVTKDSPHAKEAEMFINWIQDPKNYAACLDAYPYICTNSEALNYVGDAYKNITVFDFTDEELANSWIPKDLGDASTIYDKYWSQFMNQ